MFGNESKVKKKKNGEQKLVRSGISFSQVISLFDPLACGRAFIRVSLIDVQRGTFLKPELCAVYGFPLNVGTAVRIDWSGCVVLREPLRYAPGSRGNACARPASSRIRSCRSIDCNHHLSKSICKVHQGHIYAYFLLRKGQSRSVWDVIQGTYDFEMSRQKFGTFEHERFITFLWKKKLLPLSYFVTKYTYEGKRDAKEYLSEK